MDNVEIVMKTNAKDFENEVVRLCNDGFIVKWETFRVNDMLTDNYEARYFYVVLVRI